MASTAVAFAADLPSRRAAPVFAPPIPVFSYTGFYLGGQVGYAFGRDNGNILGSGPFADNPNGVIGGAHVGYNFSTQSLPLVGSTFGSFVSGFGFLGNRVGGVIGLEGDVDGSSYRRTVTITGAPFFPVTSLRDEIQGSIRGRLGIAVDRALFYATGGAAFAEFRTNYSTTLGFDSPSNSRVGYTVGGGIEYAVTNNVSVRAEYRFSDFGTFSDFTTNSGFGTVNRRETQQRVQGGFSYKFDTAAVAPVVAKY